MEFEALQRVVTINGKLSLSSWVGFKTGSVATCYYIRKLIISLCETAVQELFTITVNSIEDNLLSTSQMSATVLDIGDSDLRKETKPLLLQADMLNSEMKTLQMPQKCMGDR